MEDFMEIKQGYSYHIKNAFFDRVSDDTLMSNKENGHYRPHYYALQDENHKAIYWMIPISSKVEKYSRIFEKKMLRYGRCNTIVIAKFSGKDAAYLLQNAFPITSKYIDHVHTVNNVPVVVHKEIDFKLKSLLKELFALKKRGIVLFFADVDAVFNMLIKELENEEEV